jgi:two-component system response regulator HydG
MVEEGRFRKDLYFRLKVFQIRVPELRERPEDIASLAGAALARWNERVEAPRSVAGISDEAMEVLEAYDWPGNVRELMAALEYACIVSDGKRILACHLPEEVREGPVSDAHAAEGNGSGRRGGEKAAAPEPTRRYVAPEADAEREAIRAALDEAQGNRTRAAAALGMGRTTLWQKLKEYGL